MHDWLIYSDIMIVYNKFSFRMFIVVVVGVVVVVVLCIRFHHIASLQFQLSPPMVYSPLSLFFPLIYYKHIVPTTFVSSISSGSLCVCACIQMWSFVYNLKLTHTQFRLAESSVPTQIQNLSISWLLVVYSIYRKTRSVAQWWIINERSHFEPKNQLNEGEEKNGTPNETTERKPQ